MAWQWISALEQRQNLTVAQWRSLDIAFAAAFIPLLYFTPYYFSALLLLPLLLRQAAYRWRIAMAALLVLGGLLWLLFAWQSQGLSRSLVLLLQCLALAKRLEARNRRDAQFLFLLELGLLLALFMQQQSFLLLLYVLLALALLLHARLALWSMPLRRQFQPLAAGTLLALPLALLLFLLVPRLGPLWSVPQQGDGAGEHRTGLGEDMSLGDVARLAQSDEIIFRARFPAGQQPRGEDLYWRGPVLWHFDGLRWTQRVRDWSRTALPLKAKATEALHYEWIPVKGEQSWLTALDAMLPGQERIFQGRSYATRMPQGRAARNRYHLRSQPGAVLQDLDAVEEALQLPENLAIPQTRAWAQRLWQEQGSDAAAWTAAFLQHIREGEYYYSLEPPPGMGDVDAFLFSDTGKIGFCEHYANALAVAARTVGIPSRIVTGYQGGEYNPFTGDWVVRGEAAHAWTELWYGGRWHRVDPTAAVAPYRIQNARLGGESLTAGEDGRTFLSRLAESLEAASWLRQVLVAGNVFWQEWIMGYDGQRQRQLWNWQWRGIPWIYPVLLGFIALLLWVYRRQQQRQQQEGDAVAQSLQRWLRRWQKQGWQPQPGEHMGQFLRRLAAARPEQEALLQQAARHYERLRYEESASAAEFLNLLRQLQP